MTAKRRQLPAATLPAVLCAAVVLGAAPLLGPAPVARLHKPAAEIALLADEGWIMTGTGQADPTVGGSYLDLVRDFYLQPATPWFSGQPVFGDYTFEGLTTPNQFCPFVCQPPPVPQLNFGDSLTQGAADLEAAIRPQLAAGDNVTVFGYSQSAVVTTLAMHSLLADAPGGGYDPANLNAVMIGDPTSPIGGILTRLAMPDGFDGAMQHIPFVNIPMGIAPTPTEPFATTIYSAEYDGWSAFPQDPSNLLAVINAVMGISAVHGAYFDDNLANAVDLGSIGNTGFFMLPEQLPILGPLYAGGDVGKLAGDALAPVLKLAIDWSYGNPGAPDAGIAVGGVDPIGAAGPWAVTATGQLSEDTGAAGFLLAMDPLQMLAGMQYAGAQSLTNTVDNLLGLAGQDPLPQSFVDSLLGGYHATIELDQLLLSGWQDLAAQWNLLDVLGPGAVFNGAPLISAQPLLDLIGVGFSLVNYLDA